MMIPWYYAVGAFFLGGFAVVMLGVCVSLSKPTPKQKHKRIGMKWR